MIAPIVAGIYKVGKEFKGKEYFFKDRINNGLGGLQVNDIAMAYNRNAKKCVPIKITRINISSEEIKSYNVKREDMIYINFKANEFCQKLDKQKNL